VPRNPDAVKFAEETDLCHQSDIALMTYVDFDAGFPNANPP